MPKRILTDEQRSAKNAYNKAWRLANKEHCTEVAIRWQKSNPEKVRASHNKWASKNAQKRRDHAKIKRAENPEKHRAAVRASQLKHIDKVKARTKEYRENNREKVRERHKAWRHANIDHWRELKRAVKHRRRAQIAGSGGSHTIAEWHTILKAHGNKCHWCGKKEEKDFPLHRDHYISLAKGGSNAASNIVPACIPCNSKKRHRDPLEFARSMGMLL